MKYVYIKKRMSYSIHDVDTRTSFIQAFKDAGMSSYQNDDQIDEAIRNYRSCYINVNGDNEYCITRYRYERKSTEIEAGTIPVFSVKNRIKSGDYFSLSDYKNAMSKQAYAETSGFYQKIMEDGNVYNPYIHRRFLPYQYIKIMDNLDQHMDDMSLKYAYAYTIKELHKLCVLYKYDISTYKERSKFFSYQTIIEMILYIVNQCIRSNIWIFGRYSHRNSDDLATLYKIVSELVVCRSYIRLESIINNYGLDKLVFCNFPVLESFKTAYMNSGAFYTMKHLIMFEGYLFSSGQKTSDALTELNSLLINPEVNVLHERCLSLVNNNIRKEQKVS